MISTTESKSKCHCTDRGCPVHSGQPICKHTAIITLYRIDMADRTGTRFCQDCAIDAENSGLFTVATEVQS